MIANAIISYSTGVKLHDYGCSLKVFRAEVVKPLKLYGEMHRFLPAIASEMGVTIDEKVVNHRARRHGTSKYGISRTIRVDPRSADGQVPDQLFDATAAHLRPARHGHGQSWRGGLRLARVGRSSSGHEGIGNRPLLLFGILLIFTGVQLVTLGLLAEMQARTYHESQDKPIYVIRDVLEAESSRADELVEK